MASALDTLKTSRRLAFLKVSNFPDGMETLVLKGITTELHLILLFLGELPYTGIKGILELYELLEGGARLSKPLHCSDEL